MIDRLAILSPGLLGASVARAARERGAAKEIVIWARRPETRAELASQPWCSAVAETPEAAARGASLVVIASPVDAIVPLVRQIAPALSAAALVTDVGSVKAAICSGASAVTSAFVGSHPMAGSEKTGWQHGTADLFQGRTTFVTPLASTPPAAAARVAAFWTALGGTTVTVAPDVHDRIVAHISHLPQLVASTLCSYLAVAAPDWGAYSGGGLRDTTRIAGSDPALWQPILAANRPEVLAALRGLQQELARCEAALAAGDFAAVAALMARGRDYRGTLPR
jgi:prephenate dehydrogenase